MITKTPRLTILMVAMMTVLGTGGPIAAFATAYGGNNGDDDSLADRIVDDTNRIIDEALSGLPIIRPPPTAGGGDGTCAGETATIVSTDGDDNLVGTEGRDVIAGLGGNDRIEGLGGDDRMCGDAGDDTMFGGDGSDIMRGEADNDILFGTDDVVSNDNLDGGTGTDHCESDPDPEVNCES